MQLTSYNPALIERPALHLAAGNGAAPFPHAPTLLATRLQLELLLSNRPPSGSIDLREAAGILLNDLGATLEIFRRAGEHVRCAVPCGHVCGQASDEADHACAEFGSVAERLEDCLAALGTETWLEAVNAAAVERAALTPDGLLALTHFWEHARAIAYACWLLAEGSEEVAPEEAYLAGLFHEAAELPRLLGWTPAQFGAAGSRWTPPALAHLAAHFRLPGYLACLLTTSGEATRWQCLLNAAHAWYEPLPVQA